MGHRSEDGSIVTANLEAIEEDWEAQLQEQYPGTQLGGWEIVCNRDCIYNYYLLIARNEEGTVKASRLSLEGTTFKLAMTGGRTTNILVCSGCVSACAPSITNGAPFCSPCDSDGQCTKTMIAHTAK